MATSKFQKLCAYIYYMLMNYSVKKGMFLQLLYVTVFLKLIFASYKMSILIELIKIKALAMKVNKSLLSLATDYYYF